MQKSIRQSMAWLHSWTGLIFGWLLFAIFLMGSMSYYRHDINLWMQPQLSTIQVNQSVAIDTAYQYLEKHAGDAKSWFINVADSKSPVNQMYWQKIDGSYGNKTLNPNTAEEITLSNTEGGDFFYNFHFQLFGIPYLVGRLIVSLAAFIMLIALVSGIITHKKILTDFFTLRAFKGQRSYLDFHNVSSVIALPFFLTVTFTGLAIFFYLYLPWGMQKLYPENSFQYFEEINSKVISKPPENSPAKMLPMQKLQNIVKKQWGETEYSNIDVKNPNTTHAQITFTELKDHSITRNQAKISLNAITGEITENNRNQSAIATLNQGVYGLHMATFASPLLRLALFFSGILGCVMIASGLLLWSLKRQLQTKNQNFHLGHYLVNRLNIATFIGLPIAILAYFYCNRLNLISHSTFSEIHTFFTVWLFSFIVALLTPKHILWKSQLKLFILLSFGLIALDCFYFIQIQHVKSLKASWTFLSIDLFILLFMLMAIFTHQKIHPIQIKAIQKLKKKRQDLNTQELEGEV